MSITHLKEFIERIESRHGLADAKEVFVELIDLAAQFLSTGKYDRCGNGLVMPSNEQVFYMYQDLKRIVQNIPDDLVVKCIKCPQRPYSTPGNFHDKCFDCLKIDAYKDGDNCSICHNEMITKKSTNYCKYCRYELQRRLPSKPCAKCKVNERHVTRGGIKLFTCLDCKRDSNKKYRVYRDLTCGKCKVNQKHITDSGKVMGYCQSCAKEYHAIYQIKRSEYLKEYRKKHYKRKSK